MDRSLPTIGTIADQLGEPIHRIRYIIATRRIAASGRAGNARVFTLQDVDRIRTELVRIEQVRGSIRG